MFQLQHTTENTPPSGWTTTPSRPAGAVDAAHIRLEVRWAESEAEVREAQRLRHRVFVGEMGARLTVPHGTPAGVDADRFDPFCEHLLVRAVAAGDDIGPVVGTYRLLTPSGAKRAGGGYTDTEFDLSSLAPLRPRAVELGRSCVDPDWRRGGVILLLWTALSRFMVSHGLDTMIGCASIALDRDGDGAEASALWHRLRRTHMASGAVVLPFRIIRCRCIRASCCAMRESWSRRSSRATCGVARRCWGRLRSMRRSTWRTCR